MDKIAKQFYVNSIRSIANFYPIVQFANFLYEGYFTANRWFDNLDDSRLNSKELGKKPLPKYSELRSASKYLSIFENTDLDIDTLFLKLYALLKPNEYVKVCTGR